MNKSQAECSEIISTPGITSQDIYSHALIAKDQRKTRLAFLLFREAAVRGHSDAQAELALIYQYNDFMPSDWVEQLYWITKAAESGNPIYQYRLAGMYHEVGRRGVREMLPLAQQWYEKAALQEYAEAQRMLANMYLVGEISGTNNLELAEYWYLKAQENGLNVNITLANVYEQQGKINEAIRLYQEEASKGSSGSQMKVEQLQQDSSMD